MEMSLDFDSSIKVVYEMLYIIRYYSQKISMAAETSWKPRTEMSTSISANFST